MHSTVILANIVYFLSMIRCNIEGYRDYFLSNNISSLLNCLRDNKTFICDPQQMLENSIKTWANDQLIDECRPRCTCPLAKFIVVFLKERNTNLSRQFINELKSDTFAIACHLPVLIICDTERIKVEWAAEKNLRKCLSKKNLKSNSISNSLQTVINSYWKFRKSGRCSVYNSFNFKKRKLGAGYLIAIIFISVCAPIMVCIIIIFFGPCFRGSGFGGRRHKNLNQSYRYSRRYARGDGPTYFPSTSSGYSHHYKIRRSSRSLTESDSRPNQTFSSKVTFAEERKSMEPINSTPEDKNHTNCEKQSTITKGQFIENLDVEFEYEF